VGGVGVVVVVGGGGGGGGGGGLDSAWKMAPVREGGAQICICSQSGTDMMSIDIPLWSLLWYFGSCGCLNFGGQVLTGAMREVDPFSRELRSSAMREGQPGRAAALSRAHRCIYGLAHST
jgi:hypothetical protein